MTTNTPPKVLIEDHLRDHGPTKVAILTKVAGIGETTTRKILNLMEREGLVKRQGSQWLLTADAVNVTPKPKADTGDHRAHRRDEAAKRDGEVLSYLVDHGPQTRNEVADSLAVKPSEAYLSLFRLRKAGQVEKDGERWVRVTV